MFSIPYIEGTKHAGILLYSVLLKIQEKYSYKRLEFWKFYKRHEFWKFFFGEILLKRMKKFTATQLKRFKNTYRWKNTANANINHFVWRAFSEMQL